MITKIDYIKKHGLFENFKWNDDIQEFSKYNLIYGWNYSGKTTFSRLFRCVELEKLHDDFPESNFELSNSNYKIDPTDFTNHPYHFRVFNTDYIKENLKWDEQEANPIFMLGKKNIELQNKLDAIRKEIEIIKSELQSKGENKNYLHNSIEKQLTAKAQELDRIRSPYDKRKFKTVLSEIKNNISKYQLRKNEVLNLIDSIKTSRKNEILEFNIDLKIDREKYNEILDQSVVSKTIERLRVNADLNNWVKSGLVFHKDKSKCEFCQQSLPDDLLHSYEAHFSKDYEELLNKIDVLKKETNSKLVTLLLPDENRFYPQFVDEYKNVKTELEKEIELINNFIKSIFTVLEKKHSNPFNGLSQDFPNFDFEPIEKYLAKVNNLIIKHNDYNKDLLEKKKESFLNLKRHFAFEFDKDNNYFKALSQIDKLEDEIKKLDKEKFDKVIKSEEYENELSDITKASDTINDYLKSIFSSDHLQVKPNRDEKFELIRNQVKAKNLSEGEKTAIAFAYFLTRLKDKETDLEKSIVFLDDPISSLDSNHLYNTYAIIQTELNGCNQLFISTHNLEFFNLLKDWEKDLKDIDDNNDKCNIYFIERIKQDDVIVAGFKNIPSFYRKHKSEYSFLFSKILSFAKSSKTDFEDLYQMPNLIRRFLETFIGFKYGVGLKIGLKLLITDKIDRIKVKKIVNNLSHQSNLNRSLFFDDINECKNVANIVLESIKDKDDVHYRGLVESLQKAKNTNGNKTNQRWEL